MLVLDILANLILIVENQFETGFWFCWPSCKLKFQAQLNLEMCTFLEIGGKL